MIKITEQQLKAGLEISRKCSMCEKSVNCLWGNREDIPDEPCPIPEFRKIFESNSPVFYSKVREFSEYARIIHNFYGLQIEGGDQEQMHESQREFHDLHICAQVVLLTLYPLWLTNHQEIPLLMPEEIAEEQFGLPEGQIDPAGKIMHEINQEWLDWIMRITNNLYCPQKCIGLISWLVRLFIKGVQKSELPCLSEMPVCKKEQFFSELEKELYAQQTTK